MKVLFLIGLFCISLSIKAIQADSGIKAAVSGFISGTVFSDPDFYEHSA